MRIRDQRRTFGLDTDTRSGVVISSTAGLVTIATSRGAVTVGTPSATAYRPGDRVRVRNGALVGAVRSSPSRFVV